MYGVCTTLSSSARNPAQDRAARPSRPPPTSGPALDRPGDRRATVRATAENPYNVQAMKTDLHPNYVTTTVHCSCGSSFETRSTKADLHVELCNECHPFYTGKQKLDDTGGRVERFERRYGARKSKKS